MVHRQWFRPGAAAARAWHLINSRLPPPDPPAKGNVRRLTLLIAATAGTTPKRLHVITIAPYDASWPSEFAAEAANIAQVLGESALRIEHVGSTSVPGLAAKPVIDIQVSVRDLGVVGAFRHGLASIGYIHIDLGEFDLVYPFFQKPAEWPTSHHLHLCAAGGEQERKHLAFRDFLRAHPLVAGQYLALKRELAAKHDGNTMASREQYSLAKSSFIAAVLERAFREGYPHAQPAA
jgi:GrpB-like predicted nucleotidyltransferase (UPF0157 family)